MTREEIQFKISDVIVQNNWTGLIDVAPRTGKCRISLNACNRKMSICVIYPEINIKQSWVDELKKLKFTKKFKVFKYCTTRSIKKLKDKYDLLICDEIHQYSKNQLEEIKKYLNVYNSNCLGLSGSLSDESKQQINEILGLKTIYKYSIQQAIDDGIISDYEITVISTPLSLDKYKVDWKGGSFMTSEKQSFDRLSNKINDWQNYSGKQLKFMRLNRMRIIKESSAKIALTRTVINEYIGQRTLVFTGLTKVADNLGIKSYHSKTDEVNKEDFLNGKINHLAIVNKLTSGITFPKLDVAILNYFDSNCENTAQKIARITNLDYSGKVANIIIISSDEEVEKKWLNKTLSFFDKNKIKYL